MSVFISNYTYEIVSSELQYDFKNETVYDEWLYERCELTMTLRR